jgi:hypothetical protein
MPEKKGGARKNAYGKLLAIALILLLTILLPSITLASLISNKSQLTSRDQATVTFNGLSDSLIGQEFGYGAGQPFSSLGLEIKAGQLGVPNMASASSGKALQSTRIWVGNINYTYLKFLTPVSEVGFYFQDTNSTSIRIAAYAIEPDTPSAPSLEEYTVSAKAGYGGIKRPTPDINGIGIFGYHSSFPANPGDRLFVDDISFPCTAGLAYIYDTNSNLAENFKNFLNSQGFTTSLIALSNLASVNLSDFQAILIANDSGNLSNWGTTLLVNQIINANKPILGIGDGGYAFFGKLGRASGYANGAHGFLKDLFATNPSHQIFTFPNPISIAVDGKINIYVNDVNTVVIYSASLPPNVVMLGRAGPSSNYYSLTLENNRDFFWGFSGGPSEMSQPGKDLFINMVNMVAVPTHQWNRTGIAPIMNLLLD